MVSHHPFNVSEDSLEMGRAQAPSRNLLIKANHTIIEPASFPELFNIAPGLPPSSLCFGARK